jgi:APA family basic amino acid/polyamine antiporter
MEESKKMGLWSGTSLVMGNMIGGGIFLLPAALSFYGGISLVGWLVSALGSICLALVFSRLSKIVTAKNGGPYAYTQAAFGDFMGFLIAWGYWISIWAANAAITVTFVGAMSIFFPALAENRFLAVLTGLSAIWLLTWVNTRGIRETAMVQVITTLLKIIPLLVVTIGGLFFFDLDNLLPFNQSGTSNLVAIGATATLTLYAFLGFESATIPAKSIKDPLRNIPRATVLGTLLTAALYIGCTVAVMGMIPPSVLQNSPAPLAEAATRLGGSSMRYFIAGGIAVATFGALNGWIMILGQIPLALAEDHLFPKIFKRLNRKAVPASGLIIGSALVSGLMLLNYSESLVEQFKFMTLLTTLSVLTPYLFSTAAYLLLALQKQKSDYRMINILILSGLAFVYCMWAVYGSGEESVFWGFILLLMGIPFYVWVKWRHSKHSV